MKTEKSIFMMTSSIQMMIISHLQISTNNTTPLKHHKIKKTDYEWYVKVKSSQSIQTAGFGMGIERFLLFVLGKNDIRDIQVFRRFNDREDIV